MDDGGLALPESDMELDFTDIRFGGSSRNQPGIQSTSDSYFIRYNEVPGALYHEQIMSEPAKKSLIGSTCPEYLNIRPVGDFSSDMTDLCSLDVAVKRRCRHRDLHL